MSHYWIWLSEIKYIGPILQKNLLARFGCPKKVFDASEEELKFVPGMNKLVLKSLLNSKSLTHSEKILKDCEKKGVKLLIFDDECYPEHAKNSSKSPILLYYIGTLRSLNHAVGVVGSRRCSSYGKRVAQEIGAQLAELQIPLISGFAKGIDSYSQYACVKNSGYTIAFFGNGVDICYPKEQQSFYEKMISSGSAILSSYPPGTKARREYFLERNGLISAWSTEIVVVEATKKSGALWTAQFGKEEGRRILAVPNQLGVCEGEGVNWLIAEGGAIPYLGIESLEIGSRMQANKKIEPETMKNVQPHISATQAKSSEADQYPPISKLQLDILNLVHQHSQTLMEISNTLQKPENLILEELFTLELQGKVINRGNRITKLTSL